MDSEALRQLISDVEQLRRDVQHDRGLLQEMTIARVDGYKPDTPEREYADWQSWVEGWLLKRISRSHHRHRWCHRYAEHPEVADRLEALWHAWEAAWPDPKARLGWFREGLDSQWPVISAEDGPLRSCSAHEGLHVDE